MTREVDKFSIAGLAHRCRRETERFFRQVVYDERYCFELFRRALVEGNDRAWGRIMALYEALVGSWLAAHPMYARADDTHEAMVNAAFINLWRAFQGQKGGAAKFANFPSLAALLNYLKGCARTAVTSAVPTHEAEPLDDYWRIGLADPTTAADLRLAVEAVMAAARDAAKSDAELVVLEEFYVFRYRAREICDRHPDLFANAGQVQRVKDNFVERLRRNEHFRALFEPDARKSA